MLSVSIIIPVYKVELYIKRCLNSVLSQDYTGELECIIVDDCTPDNSINIVNEILTNYTGAFKVKIVRHDINRGLSVARNTGLLISSGDYIFYLDSDDELSLNSISSLVSLAEKYKLVDIVYGNWYVSLYHSFLHNEKKLPEFVNDTKVIRRLMLSEKLSMTAHNKLFRRKYLMDNHLFFKDGIFHEDSHLNYFFSTTANSIAICRIPTYVYFVNSSGIMSVVTSKRIESICTIVDDILNDSDKRYPGYKFIYCYRLLTSYYLQGDPIIPFMMRYKELYLRLYKECMKNRCFLLAFHCRIISLLSYSLFQTLNNRCFYGIIGSLIRKKYLYL